MPVEPNEVEYIYQITFFGIPFFRVHKIALARKEVELEEKYAARAREREQRESTGTPNTEYFEKPEDYGDTPSERRKAAFGSLAPDRNRERGPKSAMEVSEEARTIARATGEDASFEQNRLNQIRYLHDIYQDRCQFCGEKVFLDEEIPELALRWHHKDPKTKSFNPANTHKKMADFIFELSKCVPLHDRCHREVHKRLNAGEEMFGIRTVVGGYGVKAKDKYVTAYEKEKVTTPIEPDPVLPEDDLEERHIQTFVNPEYDMEEVSNGLLFNE